VTTKNEYSLHYFYIVLLYSCTFLRLCTLQLDLIKVLKFNLISGSVFNGGAENARLENAELENAAPNCRTGKRETGKRENGFVMESRSILNNRHTSRCYFNTPFTRYSRLYNRFDNRLYRVNKHPTGCQSGCQKGLTTGLTTMLNEQPLFVQPVVQHG